MRLEQRDVRVEDDNRMNMVGTVNRLEGSLTFKLRSATSTVDDSLQPERIVTAVELGIWVLSWKHRRRTSSGLLPSLTLRCFSV
jgi:hypothetical protein